MKDTAETLSHPVHFNNIGQIAVTVNDLERSRDFYRNVLGMKFLFDAGSMAFFQCGDVRFMIGTSAKPAQPGGTILYFRVKDILATHAALEAQGVVFAQKPHLVAKMPDHELWIAFLNDPDQNTIGLMSEVTEHAQQADEPE
jgi:catechol 2,3-dioxygenase-like lactoylglutathione lyase family enzyme